MKIKIIYTTLLVCLLCVFQPVHAQTRFTENDIMQMVEKAPSLKDFPNAGAVVLFDQKVVNINED
ncbi:hypothetical protein ACFLZG_03965, partial [Thermodesulfobacteriota bacterium]